MEKRGRSIQFALKKKACSVSAGFYLKLGGLNSRHLFLKVLEVGSPRSRCWHTVFGENYFLACRQLPLSVCSHDLFSVYAPRERALLSLPILFCPFLKLQLIYNIGFRCTTEGFNIFTDYTPCKVVIKYQLYSCTVRYPCRLFILYIVFCSSLSFIQSFPSPISLPTDIPLVVCYQYQCICFCFVTVYCSFYFFLFHI